MRFHAYLNFDGRCAEAFRFYAELFGGRLEIFTYRDSPMADQMPEGWGDRVMHASLAVGDELLMASDAPPEHFRPAAGTYVSVLVETPEEARRIFDALADGGEVEMPFAATFWSPGFGSLVDRWGIPWMVNTAGEAEGSGQSEEAAASASARTEEAGAR